MPSTGPRVLQLIDSFAVGGAENLLPLLGRSLRSQGAEVTFAALYDRPRTHVLDALETDGFDARVMNLRGLQPSTLRGVLRLVDDLQPDVIHSHLTYASIVGSLAGNLARVPAVVTLHQRGPAPWRRPPEFAREWLFRVSSAFSAQRLIAVSDATRAFYARRGVPTQKIDVVNNAIDLHRYTPASPQQRAQTRATLGLGKDETVLISVAMFRPGKGIGVLLRALRALLDQGKRATLLLAGDGTERARLERIVSDRRLGDHVRFLGLRSDIPELLSAADLFVLPSRAEAFPTVLLEAAACGLPSIASNVGGVPEILRDNDNGLLVPVGDEARLAEAIGYLIDRPDERARLAARAQADAAGYSAERWARSLLTIYAQLTPAAIAAATPVRA